jgi:hypothetical protein
MRGRRAVAEAQEEEERRYYFDRYTCLRQQLTELVQAQRSARTFKDRPRTLTATQILTHLEQLLARVADAQLCLDNCKNLYFCVRPAGHRGQHRDECGLVWP